jgi:hypothetical protein
MLSIGSSTLALRRSSFSELLKSREFGSAVRKELAA